MTELPSEHLHEPVDFARPDHDESDVEAVARVLRSGWLTTGTEAEAFEAELSEFLGGPEVVSTSSCTAALEIALASLALEPGARVGVPTWTFPASALAAVRAGADVVLLDVEPTTLNLSSESLEAAFAEGLDAVVGVHFGGVPLPAEVREFCDSAGVPLVEDAAHAFGATDDRGPVGGAGRFTCFSFYATKNLTSGEGGALATTDPEVASFARCYRLHGLGEGSVDRYRPGSLDTPDVAVPGIKGNLPDVLAALGRSQLARFSALQARRRHAAVRYRERLGDVEDLEVVPADACVGSADHLLVVLLPEGTDRSHVRMQLSERGIGSSVHFPPLHRLSWFHDHAAVGPSGVAGAESMADRVLSLPLHPGLTDGDVDRVVDVLVEDLP
ncbi:MAG: DegT/DnrJ/EryC1/StrS family aminotransferase [Acidimicrobiia bacterium]|nr:DegT/DnrJ/EryC1/StrS family aminotransferase [Acidimicrobiia bacterium]